MAVTAKLYNSFFNYLAASQYDLTSTSQKVALLGTGYTPDLAAHQVYNDVDDAEIVASGYTAGGKNVVVQTSVYNPATGLYTARIADVTWTGLTGNLRYAVVYHDTGDKPLLGYLDWGTVITRSGADFTITFPTGLLQMQRTA